LRNAGFCGSKSHQVALNFSLLLIHQSPETRAAQSRGTLAEMAENINHKNLKKNLRYTLNVYTFVKKNHENAIS
jgi:hypothetical protein